MGWQELTLIGMFLAAIMYIATLYHLAHGRERRAVALGAEIVLDALTRDGRISCDISKTHTYDDSPLNLGEEEYAMAEEQVAPLPDIIVARNERVAQQVGDRIMADLLKGSGLDEKV